MMVSFTTDGTVVSDIIEGARWQEANGTVTRITRMFFVHSLSVIRNNDEAVRIALLNVDVPQPGDVHPSLGNLVVTGRNARAVSGLHVNIEVTYELPGGGSFEPPTGSAFILSGGGSVDSVETQLYRLEQPDGTPANDPIKVFHLGEEQTGTISPFEGRQVMRAGNLFSTNAPWFMVELYVNSVNTGTFRYGPFADPRTWHITDMTYELQDRGPSPGIALYFMTISLRHNPDGWDPDVWFTDDSGRPANDLVPGVGFRKVRHYTEMDFASGSLFGP